MALQLFKAARCGIPRRAALGVLLGAGLLKIVPGCTGGPEETLKPSGPSTNRPIKSLSVSPFSKVPGPFPSSIVTSSYGNVLLADTRPLGALSTADGLFAITSEGVSLQQSFAATLALYNYLGLIVPTGSGPGIILTNDGLLNLGDGQISPLPNGFTYATGAIVLGSAIYVSCANFDPATQLFLANGAVVVYNTQPSGSLILSPNPPFTTSGPNATGIVALNDQMFMVLNSGLVAQGNAPTQGPASLDIMDTNGVSHHPNIMLGQNMTAQLAGTIAVIGGIAIFGTADQTGMYVLVDLNTERVTPLLIPAPKGANFSHVVADEGNGVFWLIEHGGPGIPGQVAVVGLDGTLLALTSFNSPAGFAALYQGGLLVTTETGVVLIQPGY